jgi:ACS family tartrate transporter-like MFS transporter
MPHPPGDSRSAALDSAIGKAMLRLMPLVFLCYAIAYINRSNVSIAALTMVKDLPGFDMNVIGDGAGWFFFGYFLLEVPGSLIVERWSARKWITRIMVTWGIIAACTALVHTPRQFIFVRTLLGLAEAGFFPGVIVYLTHWFPRKARARALSYYMIAQPAAQIISPPVSGWMVKIGSTEKINGVLVNHPMFLGLKGWQWIYVAWGVPAVLLGVAVFFWLTDRPSQAKWLTAEERDALEAELEAERAQHRTGHGISVWKAVLESVSNGRVLLLSLAYFFAIYAAYGVEFFLPSVLERWYALRFQSIGFLVILPPVLALAALLLAGWSSDRRRERRFHASTPLLVGGIFLLLTPFMQGHLALTIAFFMLAWAGFKAYLPAFWSLPNTFLTETVAASSIGLINSLGNLGGYAGPKTMGLVEKLTGSFAGGLTFLGVAMFAATALIFFIASVKPPQAVAQADAGSAKAS